jgi:putative DNA primase/helicase
VRPYTTQAKQATRDDIIAANPILEFLQRRGYTLRPRGGDYVTAGCPVAQHKRGHLCVTIDTRRQVFHCNDCDVGGTVIDWLIHEQGISAASAMRELSGNGAMPRPAAFDWGKCVAAFTNKHVGQIAKWRGFSEAFVRELRDNGHIGIHRGLVAFPVHNNGKIVGAHFRLKSGAWNYFPTGIKAAPLVFGELIAGERMNVFESQWDAFAFMNVSGERDGIIVTRGAGNAKLAVALIPQRSTAYLWTQNDDAGAKWERDFVANAKCACKRVRFLAHDLNDWTRDGATCDDLLGAIVKAETLREPEISWSHALSESVITSSELHGLKLTPRKKLLGDWFCEGDCGFVFAFRGVGKTWLAVAMAKTIASGGMLGDWEAHEPVKTLYVDSEMPADLMRQRSIGLGTDDNFQIINHDILFERTGKILNIASPDIQDAITKHCIKTGVKVLFIDNLSTAAFGLKENEADSWEKMLPWLLDLRRRKIAVVIVHHAGRSGEMRGTTKREDSVFWIIALDDMKKNADDKRGARFVSHFTKPSRNTQEELPAYEWHFVTESDGQVTIAHKPAQSLDVFRNVIESGVTRCEEIAEAMKLRPFAVSRLAKKAIDAGWLKKTGRSYALVEGKQ